MASDARATTVSDEETGVWYVYGLSSDGLDKFREGRPGLNGEALLLALQSGGYRVEFVAGHPEEPAAAPGQTMLEISADPLSNRVILQEMIDKLRGPDGRAASREVALAITKLQEARYWLGESQFGGG